jgi:hypothetical protein
LKKFNVAFKFSLISILSLSVTLILANTNPNPNPVSTVFSQGLIALSVNGNEITGKGIGSLRMSVRNNHWFLGLNLANNRIEEDGIELLVRSLKHNSAMHAVLIGGNPGFRWVRVRVKFRFRVRVLVRVGVYVRSFT